MGLERMRRIGPWKSLLKECFSDVDVLLYLFIIRTSLNIICHGVIKLIVTQISEELCLSVNISMVNISRKNMLFVQADAANN